MLFPTSLKYVIRLICTLSSLHKATMSSKSVRTGNWVRVLHNTELLVLSTAPDLCRCHVNIVVSNSVHFFSTRSFYSVNNETLRSCLTKSSLVRPSSRFNATYFALSAKICVVLRCFEHPPVPIWLSLSVSRLMEALPASTTGRAVLTVSRTIHCLAWLKA